MDDILNVDANSSQWREVVRFIEARIAQLTEDCVSIGSTAEQRAFAAHRIDELRELMTAPQRTRTKTEARINSRPLDSGVY